jgi:cell division transport system permease protein
VRAQFVLSETKIGFRRNLTLTIAVVVTIGVSLALLGVSLLLRDQIDAMKGYWYDRIQVSIFLDQNVTQEQREEIRADIEALPEVEQVFYESKDEANERCLEQFEANPTIREQCSAEVLPESFRVKLENPEEYEVVTSAFEERAGVDQVVNQREVLDKFFRVLRRIQRGAEIFALVSFFATVLLVFNMIRVAAFNRRRETGIMRLVGASNLYIQLPFLLEGAFAGLIGASAALGLLAVFKAYVMDGFKEDFSFTTLIGWSAFWGRAPLIVLTGVGLASIASYFTLRRYLRV